MKNQTLLMILLISCPLFARTFLTEAEFREETEYIQSLEPLKVTKTRDVLPSRVDNSERKYFPPIFNQKGGSCVVASRVGYFATYLNNYLYDEDASDPDHQLSHRFIYNMFNGGSSSNGASTRHMAPALAEIGCITNADWEVHGKNDFTTWVNGYDVYLKALKYRTRLIDRSHPLITMENIETAKQWLYQMKEGSIGGLFFINGYYTNHVYDTITSGPEIGKEYIKVAATEGGHAFTIVGYDDSLCFDFNDDGKFTTDIDINGDGEITLADHERGAFILANSWGTYHGNDGFVYAPYRHWGVPNEEGGMGTQFLLGAYYLVEEKPKVRGVLEILMTLENRDDLRNYLGYGNQGDTPISSEMLTALNSYAGAFPLAGEHNGHTLTYALDISDWISRAESLGDADVFWGAFTKEVSGQIHSVKFHDYRGESEKVTTVPHPAVFDSGITWIKIPIDMNNSGEKLAASNVSLKGKIGEEILHSLVVSGGTAPYTYELKPEWYHMQCSRRDAPVLDYDTMSYRDHYATHLPIDSTYFLGGYYDTLSFVPTGVLAFNAQPGDRLDFPKTTDYLYNFKGKGISAGVYVGRTESDPSYVEYKKTDNEIYLHYKTNSIDRPRLLDTPCELTYRIARDGTIDIYYNQFPTDVEFTEEIVMGISNVYDRVQQYPIHSYNEFADSLSRDKVFTISYLPPKLPEEISLDGQGSLKIKSSVADNFRIPVEVTDSKGDKVMASVEFSTKETAIVASTQHLQSASLTASKKSLTINNLTQKASLSLYRANGQRVFETDLKAASVQHVAVPNIARGVYLAEIKGAGVSLSKKFVR